MSFVACKDKNRRKRVEASGTLPRKTYYCPNPKCDAELILVDCDDGTRSDHFRLKNGFMHIYNCEFAVNDKRIKGNGFTEEEYVFIERELEKVKYNLEKIVDLLLSYVQKNENINEDVNEIICQWLECDLHNKKELIRVFNNFNIVRKYIEKFSMDKFKYGIHKESTVGYCWPFAFLRIELCYPLFRSKNSLMLQETIVHEAFHQRLWKGDIKYGEIALSLHKALKYFNADNWSSCYRDLLPFLKSV